MPNPNKEKPNKVNLAKYGDSKLSEEDKMELSVQLHKELKSLKGRADEQGFTFLSYLLEMALLETQSIVSGTTEAQVDHCETCGSSK